MNFDALQHPENLSRIPGYGLFWAISVPLMVVTIILPMLFGTLLHWLRTTTLTIVLTAVVDMALLVVILLNEFYFRRMQDVTKDWHLGVSGGFDGITSYAGIVFIMFYMGFPATTLMMRLSEYFQEKNIGTAPQFLDVFKCMAVADVSGGFWMAILYWCIWYNGKLLVLNFFWVALFCCWRGFRLWWSSKGVKQSAET